jgi:hypothetical protein
MVVAVPLTLLGQVAQGQPGAILHTQGGVWVNGAEARDSSAVFAGDLVETKTGFSASLSLDGSTVLIGPESVTKFQGDFLELDHGSVSVGTSKSFRVKVNCIFVVPVLNEWTQYEVTDINGRVDVAARKLDVNVEHEGRHNASPVPTTPSPAPDASQQRASVHEGEQHTYDESQICGAAGPVGAGGLMNPKWIAIGAGAGAGIICALLCRGGGGKTPLSASSP